MFTHAIAADSDASVLHHRVPEELSGLVPFSIALNVSNSLIANNFRNLRVGVHACKTVLATQERFEYSHVRESLGKFHESLVTTDCCRVGKRLVESAVLAIEHALQLVVTEILGQLIHPVGQCYKHLLRLLAASEKVRVTKSGVDFVNIVERHPSVVQSERRLTYIAFRNFLPLLFAVNDSAEIAVAVSFCTAFQLGNAVVESVLYLLVSCRGIHIGER